MITLTLLNINNSANFLLYCLAGKQFREVFFVMCGCGSNSNNTEQKDNAFQRERMTNSKQTQNTVEIFSSSI